MKQKHGLDRSLNRVGLMLAVFTFGYGLASGGAATPGGEWESYNKTHDGERFSPLTQINSKNASSIEEVCRYRVADGGTFQSGLVMTEGILFATTASDTVAFDPSNCAVKWRHSYQEHQAPTLPLNRGVAYLNGRVFRGTDDARLIALDAFTGKELWSSIVGDPRLGELVTGAPISWNGLVIVGTAVGEFGIRGRVMAFDALSGREVWRFNTIPSDDEVGADSWENKGSAKFGGGGTWSTFSIDQSTGELFIPVGNPEPAFSGSDRPGKNLFTNSVVVLDASTGKLKWWYQLIPNDSLDYDLGAAPMLFNTRNGPMLAAATKDG
jgi:alcohol dehydrogenase (cytochrome c)